MVGVFKRNGRWKKQHIHTPWNYPTDPQPQGRSILRAASSTRSGTSTATTSGAAIRPTWIRPAWEPDRLLPGRAHKYDSYCFLDKNLAQAACRR